MTIQIYIVIIEQIFTKKGVIIIKTFLSLGSKHIFPELFQPIKNTEGAKPCGGLWATKQNEFEFDYNSWVNFLSYNINILFYKNHFDNPFKVPAVFLTLKDNANIFILSNKNELDFLRTQYSDKRDWIDFEMLTKDYDGIYVNVFQLFQENLDSETKCKILSFSVDSLILFSLDCIEFYQQAEVDIEPFDYEYEKEFTNYKINISPQKEKINSVIDCISLINNIKDFIIKYTGSEETLYAQIHNKFKDEIATTVKVIENNNENLQTENIEALLIRKSFQSI